MSNCVKTFRTELTNYVHILQERANEAHLNDLAQLRQFPIQLLKDLGVFYIDDGVELLLPAYLHLLQDFGIISKTTNKPMFNARYIFPIKDMDGLIMGIVGYCPNSKERYLYATTKYFQRSSIMYGMENFEKCMKQGYIIVTEGITDAMAIKKIGYELDHFGMKYTHSTTGAHESLYMMQLLDLIHCVIFIPDRDRAGDGTKKYWKTSNYVRLLIPFNFKDLDEFIKSSPENKLLFQDNLLRAIDYVVTNKNYCGEELPIYG